MLEKKTFLIITWNKYPEEDAGAVRQHAFAKNLDELGYKPIIIGMGKTTKFQQCKYDGVSYFSLRYASSNLLSRVLGRKFFTLNLKKLINTMDPSQIKGILIVSGEKSTFSFVKKYAKKHQIQLYHDSVEWYSPCEFKAGEKDPAYRHNNNINTKYIDKDYKVIAISTLLEKHFTQKNITTIRIPVIMDVQNTFCEKKQNDTVQFLYAGSIGGKDLIEEFIEAIGMLEDEKRKKVEFNILGITYENYMKLHKPIPDNVLEESVHFKGRVSRDVVQEYLKTTDFTVLLRPAGERYANAGFPTKVVESLTNSTPVLCNITSDLGMYLKNEENAIILPDIDRKSCLCALKKILDMDKNDFASMRVSARKTALECFDRRLYLHELKDLIEK